ncbi:MAG: LamG domain-containing protein [Planctomycetes bacterium]|nr:LamG domain-containing protein [Planctomycetota bacterium]
MSKSRLIIVMVLSLMTLPSWAADKSLVLYLPLDEGSGTTARDASTYNNPGRVVGNATWVPGAKGTALQFVNGSRVTIPEIPQYDVTSAVSLLAWVKASTVPNWARVIDKSQWQTSGFDLVLTQNVGLARLEFFVNNTTSLVDSTTVVANNEWHFIVGTFGNKTLRIYVDGKREGQAQSVGQVDINPNNLPLMIGGESSSNGGQQYLGSIDEPAMYNRELSAEEIAKIFQGGMAMPESAANPQPKSGATDVPRDIVLGWTPGGFAASHDVYLGTGAADVNNAGRASPMGVLASRGQTDATFDPAGLLEYGRTRGLELHHRAVRVPGHAGGGHGFRLGGQPGAAEHDQRLRPQRRRRALHRGHADVAEQRSQARVDSLRVRPGL